MLNVFKTLNILFLSSQNISVMTSQISKTGLLISMDRLSTRLDFADTRSKLAAVLQKLPRMTSGRDVPANFPLFYYFVRVQTVDCVSSECSGYCNIWRGGRYWVTTSHRDSLERMGTRSGRGKKDRGKNYQTEENLILIIFEVFQDQLLQLFHLVPFFYSETASIPLSQGWSSRCPDVPAPSSCPNLIVGTCLCTYTRTCPSPPHIAVSYPHNFYHALGNFQVFLTPTKSSPYLQTFIFLLQPFTSCTS